MTHARLGNAFLTVLVVALSAAFVLLPGPFAHLMSGRSYGDEQRLTEKVTTTFVSYWQAGKHALTPQLSQLVEYWQWYHVAKAATAIGLLVVLIVLATRLWKTYGRAGTPGAGWSSATAGVVVTMLSVFAFVLALANVQGAFAPLASLMSLLPIDSPHGDLAVMIGQVKDGLANYSSASSPGPLRMMVGDLATYHGAAAVISWLTAAVLIVLMIASWRTYARTAKADKRPKRLFMTLGIGSLLLAAVIVVLALANTSTALDSPTAVLNFYKGSI